jgi:hypothetical protein
MTISLLQNAQPLNVVYSPIVIFMEKGKRQIYMLYGLYVCNYTYNILLFLITKQRNANLYLRRSFVFDFLISLFFFHLANSSPPQTLYPANSFDSSHFLQCPLLIVHK